MARDPFEAKRERLLREVRNDFADTQGWTGRPAPSERVMAALAAVPREKFVPESAVDAAYANRPLPIGHGQTISQPFIVALMSELLDPGPHDSVLEIGTGCGYQAAMLAHLARHVYSVEVVSELAEAARERLAALGYGNVSVTCADGYDGWADHAPFDGIMTTAAPEGIPRALTDQLRKGGRLVLPVGPPGGPQHLRRLEKQEDGSLEDRKALPVAFVPMVRRPGA